MLRQAQSSPKLKRLKRRLRIPQYAAVGILESLWHMTATQAPRGDIGKWSDEDIAANLEWEGDETALIEALAGCGWLDEHPEHRLVVHDWHVHADSNVKRSPQVKEHGFALPVGEKTSISDSPPVDHACDTGETPVDHTCPTGQLGPGPGPGPGPATARAREGDLEADFSEWYGRYPRKVARGAAVRAYRTARKKVDHATLMAGLERYIAGKPPDISWCYPATWLNGERWSDELAGTDPAGPPPKDWSQPENRRECVAFYVEHIDDEAARWDSKWGGPPTEAEIAAVREAGAGDSPSPETADDLLEIPPFLRRDPPTPGDGEHQC